MASTPAFPLYQLDSAHTGFVSTHGNQPNSSLRNRRAGEPKRIDLDDRATPYRRSYVNDAVDILKSAGRSLKLHDLQSRISAKRGKPISLGSLKVCLSRYVDTSDDSKLLTRLAPGLFGLTEWERENAPEYRALAAAASSQSYSDSLTKLESVAIGDLLNSSSTTNIYVWTLQEDVEAGGEEQKVMIRARDEQEAYLRLELAGVLGARRGLLRPRS